MKFTCLLLFVCIACSCCCAQTASPNHLTHSSDSVLTNVEIESTFPGGVTGWTKFLQENLVYPKKALRKNIQGTVIAQFIVDKDGTVSDIEAIDGPELLREAAVDIIRKSPNWRPAQQHGRKVKSYKKQPITFKIQ